MVCCMRHAASCMLHARLHIVTGVAFLASDTRRRHGVGVMLFYWQRTTLLAARHTCHMTMCII